MKLTLHATPMIRYWSYPFWSSMQKRASQDTLWIIPIRNMIVERSFSFRRRVHNWLHNSMPKRLLREIVVNFMFDYTFFIKYRYKQCLYDHPSSWVYRHFELMLDIWDICIFCRLLSLWYCYLLFCKELWRHLISLWLYSLNFIAWPNLLWCRMYLIKFWLK